MGLIAATCVQIQRWLVGVDRATDTTSQCGRGIKASGLYQRETVAIRGDKVGSEGRGSGVVVVGGRSARTTDG